MVGGQPLYEQENEESFLLVVVPAGAEISFSCDKILVSRLTGHGGGTGIRVGLKNQWRATSVWVRLPPMAPGNQAYKPSTSGTMHHVCSQQQT